MADKTYKIDKSKDAMSDTPWQDIDKTELRNKIIEAKNKVTLVKSVYLLVEDGWEEAPSEKLKYPVMEIKGDKIVYNRNALASALGYAKKENEESVVSKVEAIYKKLGLGKEDDAKMAEIKFAAVDIADMWSCLYEAINRRHDWEYSISGIYEQDNKKFAVLKDRGGESYRLDFSLTEEGLTIADEIVKVQTEFIETDDVKKFAEPENVAKYKKFEDCGCENDGDDSHEDDGREDEDFAAKCAEMEKKIEERDNIIMEKDKKMEEMEKELVDLREFKKTCMEKDKACAVESVMNEVKDFMNDEQFKALRDEGMACEFAQIDAWSNKVKAISFESVKSNKKSKGFGVMKFSAPVDNTNNKSSSVWDRLKNL